jgi:hypothetical protein
MNTSPKKKIISGSNKMNTVSLIAATANYIVSIERIPPKQIMGDKH